MNILNQVLSNLNLRKTQTGFLQLLCTVILAIPSRINYANLERFSHLNEKTFRNWFSKPLDWVLVTSNLVQTLQASNRMGKRLILGVDCTNLRKAGKHTPGLAKFWDSKLGKAIPSLELSCCTLIDLEYRQPIPIHALQTPSVLPTAQSRVDHYTNHVQNVLKALPSGLCDQIECVVADAYYAKSLFMKGFSSRAISYKLQAVSQKRCSLELIAWSLEPKPPHNPSAFFKMDFINTR